MKKKLTGLPEVNGEMIHEDDLENYCAYNPSTICCCMCLSVVDHDRTERIIDNEGKIYCPKCYWDTHFYCEDCESECPLMDRQKSGRCIHCENKWDSLPKRKFKVTILTRKTDTILAIVEINVLADIGEFRTTVALADQIREIKAGLIYEIIKEIK